MFSLNFLLLKHLPESLSAALEQANGQLRPFSCLVRFASHLPRLLGCLYFFPAIWAFSHNFCLPFTVMCGFYIKHFP